MSMELDINSPFTLPTPKSIPSNQGNFPAFTPYKISGDIPSFRLKSSYCVTDNDKLFLFGGFDEDDNIDGNVYILDLQSGEWIKKRHKVYREGHSCSYIGNDHVMIIGGEQYVEDEDNIDTQFAGCSVLLYDILADRFFKPDKVKYPNSRSRHATCVTPDRTKLFVSGGIGGNNMSSPIGDLYCLDLINLVWSGPIEFVTSFDHFITYHESKIYSFGGLTKDMNHVNKISWIDLETNLVGEIKLKDIPRQMGGDNIYISPQLYNPGIVLNVLIPLWNPMLDQNQRPASIATFDLHKLRWNMAVVGDYPLKGICWRQSFVSYDHLYLIGSSSKNSDSQLSQVFKFKISNLGISKLDTNGIGSNFINDFALMLNDDQFTDFQIFGKDHEDDEMIDTNELEQVQNRAGPINVHKSILIARWPHFKRVIGSGMVESSSNKMYIPEPISRLRGLITFLYTNKLNSSVTNTIDDYTGLLILANMYELDELKSICLEKIYHSISVDNLIFIWKRSIIANEPILTSNCCKYMYDNWGFIVKTEEFRNLERDLLLKLFEGMDEKSKIISSDFKKLQPLNVVDDDDDGILMEDDAPLTSLHTGLLTRLSSPQQRRDDDYNSSNNFYHNNSNNHTTSTVNTHPWFE